MDRLENRHPQRRSALLHGLGLALRHWRAFVWTWALQIGITGLSTIRFHSQASALLSHSLASARLFSAFDLGVLTEAMNSLSRTYGPGKATWSISSFVFALVYFVTTPGVLACYQAGERASLRTMCWHGMHLFWRFVRITVVALLSSIMLAAMLMLRDTALVSLNRHGILGLREALFTALTGLLVFLAASLMRLYFDLVEVYAVRRSLEHDRRIGPAFVAALRLLRVRLLPAWGGFLALTLLGIGSIGGSAYLALHRLAAPHWMGLFAILQTGIAIDLFTRFWQRGAETILVQDAPGPQPPPATVPDAIPDPEPPAPTLPEPDRGIFEGERSSDLENQ